MTGNSLDFPIKAIRFSLALVFIWFGILKLFNISSVFDVVANAYPLIVAYPAAYFSLAILEVALGLGMLVPKFARVTGSIMVGHLTFATLGVLFSFQAWNGGFPGLSIVGEFAVKNFVLIAGALAVVSYRRPS